MKTKIHARNRIARFEALESRHVMSVGVGMELQHTLSMAIEPQLPDHAAVPDLRAPMQAGTPQQVWAALGSMKADQAGQASGVTFSKVRSASQQRDILLETQTDGVCGDLWRGLKRAASTVGETVAKGVIILANTARMLNPRLNSLISDVNVRQENEKFSKVSILNVDQLLPGDVIVLSGTGAMRGAIRYATNSQFNHTAIYIGDGYVIDATDCFGVSRRALKDLLDNTQVFVGVLRRVGLTAEQRCAIVLEAGYHLGAQYSNWSGAGSATGLISIEPGCKSREPLNCSELVQKVYYSALGYRFTSRDYPSPGDLALAPGLTAVGKLRG